MGSYTCSATLKPTCLNKFGSHALRSSVLSSPRLRRLRHRKNKKATHKHRTEDHSNAGWMV